MKTSFFTFLFLFSINLSASSESCQLNLRRSIAGGKVNYQVIGESSSQLKAAFFHYFQKAPNKKYVWKFKKVIIPGMDKPVTLQVHQGLHGTKEATANSCASGGSYFNTFINEKYKTEREAQSLNNEEPALLIYIKQGRQFGVNCDKAEYVEKFISTVYDDFLVSG